MRLIEVKTATQSKLMGRKICESLRKDCGPLLNIMPSGYSLFTECKTINIAERKKSKECDTLKEVFSILGESLPEGKNGIIVSTSESYDNKVVFPIGDFKFAWSQSLENPVNINELKDYFDLDEELVTPFKESTLQQLEDFQRSQVVEVNTKKWNSYLNEKAQEYYSNLGVADPDHYETNINELIEKWLEHYKSHIEEEITSRMKSPDIVKIINDALALKTTEELDANFNKYHTFNRKRFIENESKNYNVSAFNEGVESGNNILIICEEYYAIDSDFYNYFVKDKL